MSQSAKTQNKQLKTQNSLWLSVILCLLCLGNGCRIAPGGFFGDVTPPPRQQLVFANDSEPHSLDPHKIQGVPDMNVTRELFEGLTVAAPKTLEPVPAGAASWESQQAGQVWIFHLRPTARWTDGQPVTAGDYVYAWQRALNPETGSLYGILLGDVRNAEKFSTEIDETTGKSKHDASILGVTAVDDLTLRVELERPAPYFLQLTSHSVFAPVPRKAIEAFGPAWTRPEHIVSNGPFKLISHRINDEIVLSPNPGYWDAGSVKLKEVRFLPVKGETAINLYKAGEVGVMMSGMIPRAFMSALKTKADFYSGANFSTYFYSFNTRKAPFDKPEVRQALSLAVNKQEITDKLLAGGQIPARTFVPPGVVGYQSPSGAEFNPQTAQKLLAQAGFPQGKGFPRCTLLFVTDDTSRQIAETVQRMWQENLGITIELQNEEWNTLGTRIGAGEFDLCQELWVGDYVDPKTFLDLMQSKNSSNHAGMNDPVYDSLLDQANRAETPAQRLHLLTEAETYLLERAPVLPLYHPPVSYLKKPYVQGFELNTGDFHQLKFVSIKEKLQ
ncbi:MAG: peptide ABC transporter substrate-binding protein [Blastocatellia bacterium]|nr:peptide ABC transporter substrate-binding protein [Blastocatellia bacterium]